ncbi:MAG: hypothetical protein JST21_16590 [Bacteroidetes bacterium]|nr:hypothetical protein [Bacteroidota bacterium]
MDSHKKDIQFSLLWFSLSMLLTGFFIGQNYWLYRSVGFMILSICIASGKWVLQIIGALMFLNENKWSFIRSIGKICFIGSLVLYVYFIFNYLPLPIGGLVQFVLSITISVWVMVFLYYQAISKTGLSAIWFWSWVFSLCAAVALQFFIVF